MKKFLAIYTGSPQSMNSSQWNSLSDSARKEREMQGINAWKKWGTDHAKSIKDTGAPLGKTKKVDASGISDIKNQMAAFTIVEAESHEAAAKIFLNHPHFSIFPGDSVEIMECLPIPGM